MRTVQFKTSVRVSVPKLFSCELFGNIVHETEKAYLLDDVVQEHGNLHLSRRWIAKSQVESMSEEVHNWEYSYKDLVGGIPAGLSELQEVAQ